MKTNFEDFVRDAARKMDDFNSRDRECIQQIVREAISFYNMNSYEEVEDTGAGAARFLYIHSMAEENLLSKIAEISMKSADFDIEYVYEGRVIREY